MRRRHCAILFLALLAVTSTASADSGKTSAVGQVAPVGDSPPSISGSPIVGNKLSANSGTWKGPAPSYSYQWVRCSSSGTSCAPIPAATLQDYIPAVADLGSELRVVVTASNKNGSTVSTSDPTSSVEAATQSSTSSTTSTTSPTSTTSTWTTTTSSLSSTTTTTQGSYSPPSSIASDCSVDVTSALGSWLGLVPNGSTVSFGGCYRIEGTLQMTGRTLTLEGGRFRSFNAMTHGSFFADQRAVWRFYGSTVTIRNMTVTGAYTNGGTLDETLQHAHAIDLRGSSATITGLTASNLAGDCVYFGLNGSTGSTGSVQDSSCIGTSRNAVSVVAGHDITVQRVTTDRIGLIAFDVEPNAGGGSVQRVRFDANTIGSYYLYAYAIVESMPISTQSFTNNTVNGPLKVGAVDPGNDGYRPQDVTVSGNHSTGGSMEFHDVDGLTVANNTVALGSITFSGCTGIVAS
jgi:hypothetical protein